MKGDDGIGPTEEESIKELSSSEEDGGCGLTILLEETLGSACRFADALRPDMKGRSDPTITMQSGGCGTHTHSRQYTHTI